MILPEHRWWAAEPLWRMAEEYGFAHAWTYDRVGWRPPADKPWFAAVPTLTAAATVTEQIRLGSLLTDPGLKHPAHFAREITALDDISDGRLTIGLGAGSGSEALGRPALTEQQRIDQFTEFLELLDRILVNDVTDYEGEHYSAVQARRSPGCVQRPRTPFVIAADQPRTMRLAARFGQGWLTAGRPASDEEQWWRSVAELADAFAEEADKASTRNSTMDKYLCLDASPVYSMSSVDKFQDSVGRAAELGFTDVVAHWPRPDEPYRGHESTLEKIATEVLPEL